MALQSRRRVSSSLHSRRGVVVNQNPYYLNHNAIFILAALCLAIFAVGLIVGTNMFGGDVTVLPPPAAETAPQMLVASSIDNQPPLIRGAGTALTPMEQKKDEEIKNAYAASSSSKSIQQAIEMERAKLKDEHYAIEKELTAKLAAATDQIKHLKMERDGLNLPIDELTSFQKDDKKQQQRQRQVVRPPVRMRTTTKRQKRAVVVSERDNKDDNEISELEMVDRLRDHQNRLSHFLQNPNLSSTIISLEGNLPPKNQRRIAENFIKYSC